MHPIGRLAGRIEVRADGSRGVRRHCSSRALAITNDFGRIPHRGTWFGARSSTRAPFGAKNAHRFSKSAVGGFLKLPIGFASGNISMLHDITLLVVVVSRAVLCPVIFEHLPRTTDLVARHGPT